MLRRPGRALAQVDEPIDVLVAWLAAHLEVPVAAFAEYARRPQTMTDHARLLAATLGLRPAGRADLPVMIEAAAQSAWSTDRGAPIVAGVIAALHVGQIILPAPAVIERCAIAGRARARKRVADFGFVRMRIGDQQSLSGEDHPWCAITTLDRAVTQESPLQRRQLIRGAAMPFERRHASSVGLKRQNQARVDRLAVKQDRARAAFAFATPHFHAGEPQIIAKQGRQT